MDKKWNIFGAPRDTLELIEKREKDIEKEQVKFETDMNTA
jgi:dynein heavy chain, axonemal